MECPECQAELVSSAEGFSCPRCSWAIEESEMFEMRCWLDMARICAEDCVAWDDRHAQEGFSVCRWLNLGRSVAKDARRIAEGINGLVRMAGQPPPPEVR